VGESAIDHTEGRGIERVRSQLRTALDGISPHEASALLVAYEPVWAIGEAGVPAEPEEVAMVVDAMRGELDARFEPDARPPVLYGGSVDRTNCAAFAAIPAIDGLFVGRAAWTVSGFAETPCGREPLASGVWMSRNKRRNMWEALSVSAYTFWIFWVDR